MYLTKIGSFYDHEVSSFEFRWNWYIMKMKAGDFMKEFRVNENDADQRLDKYIQKTCFELPKSLMFRFIRQKKIKVNRKRSEPSYILQKDDTIQMFISDEFFVNKKMDVSKAAKLSGIVYEDKNFLILDKEAGMIVHSNNKFEDNTLIQRVLKYLIDTKA